MDSGFVIRKNQYYDSVFLMGVNKRLSGFAGVRQTAVLMGSERNKRLLHDIGVQDPQIETAQADDLIVAVVADTPETVKMVLGQLEEALQAGESGAPASALRTLEEGLAQKPNANLAVISIPGEYAAHETDKALVAGLNVFLFSGNVALEEELRLKQRAHASGLLVMGPDCGTSLIGGVGLGFANAVRRGPIGVVGAAGTGLQEFTSQVHNAGLGISHAIGTGSHDLSDSIGGLTTFQALEALEADPQTKVIGLISKPPGPQTLRKLLDRLQRSPKPVVGCFLGTRLSPMEAGHLHVARTIDDAVELAIRSTFEPLTGGAPVEPCDQERMAAERAGWSPAQRYLRGIFAGGTFCYQAQQILQAAGISLHSNVPLDPAARLPHPDQSIGHTLVDMGDDYYTLGKPHPMLDGTLRRQRILTESRDPAVAVLLLDFILGYNVSMDPVGELFDAILEARLAAKQRGGALTVVASICGTADDPQDLNLQTRLLHEAGIIVFGSSARAARFACDLLQLL